MSPLRWESFYKGKNMVAYLPTSALHRTKTVVPSRSYVYSRLTRDGYTKLAGCPTDRMVWFRGRWRRVYYVQVSNASSQFVNYRGKRLYLS